MHVDSTPQQIAKIAATVLGLLSQVPACKLERITYKLRRSPLLQIT